MKKNKKWYLPDCNTFESIGPFTTSDIEKKLKSGEILLDSFIWFDQQVDERWIRVYECKEFHQFLMIYPKCKLPKKRSQGLSSQVISVQFKHNGSGEYGKENNYRRYPRAPISAKSIVHNQDIYSEAICVDISEKGVLLEVDDLLVYREGEEVMLTVFEHNYLETFSVGAVVIHKAVRTDRNMLGLFFLRIPPQLKRKVAEYVISQLDHDEIVMEEKTA